MVMRKTFRKILRSLCSSKKQCSLAISASRSSPYWPKKEALSCRNQRTPTASQPSILVREINTFFPNVEDSWRVRLLHRLWCLHRSSVSCKSSSSLAFSDMCHHTPKPSLVVGQSSMFVSNLHDSWRAGLLQKLGYLHNPSACRSSSSLAFPDMSNQAQQSCSIAASELELHEAEMCTDRVQESAPCEDDRSYVVSKAENIKGSRVDAGKEHKETRVQCRSNRSAARFNGDSKKSIMLQESVEGLEDLLKDMEAEASAEDSRIGAMCLRLAQLCISTNEDPDKILTYGQRALKVLGSPEVSLECATCLEVIGCAYHKKGEFEKAAVHLERAAMILEMLKGTVKESEMGSLKYAVQALLGQVNMALGREDEAILNFQDAIAINERVLDTHDPNLGKSYQQLAEAFMRVQDLEEALTLCKKALPIYIKSYGSNSSQVAELRKLLAAIYYGLDQFEEVLSEHQLLRSILKGLGRSEEVASIDLASGEALLCLDRFLEAIPKLKDVVEQTTTASHTQGQALVLLAKANAGLREHKDAIMYCKKALDVLRSKTPSVETGASLVELALVLGQLKEKEESLMTFKMSLEIYRQYPQEQGAIAYIEAQIGLHYFNSKKIIEALPYLEGCVAKDEDILGLQGKDLLDMYNQMGAAYIQLGNLDEALSNLEAAKALAFKKKMSKELTTIGLYKNLVHVYTALGRLRDALFCQQLLIEAIKEMGSEIDVSLTEAQEKLKELMEEATKRRESMKVENLPEERMLPCNQQDLPVMDAKIASSV